MFCVRFGEKLLESFLVFFLEHFEMGGVASIDLHDGFDPLRDFEDYVHNNLVCTLGPRQVHVLVLLLMRHCDRNNAVALPTPIFFVHPPFAITLTIDVGVKAAYVAKLHCLTFI